jgi:prophage regulatory protein
MHTNSPATVDDASPSTSVAHRRVIRKALVLDRVAFSYTTLWRKVRDGSFPRPIKQSSGTVAWFEDEVDAWLSARAAERS